MPAVPELVEWQLLAGLQLLIEPYGVTMALDRLAMAWAHVGRARVGSVRELGELPGTYPSQRALEIAIIAARRLTTTPEEERVKDVWDLGVFGLGEKRAMDFTGLHQRWLRESVKGYTIERLSSRKLRTAHRDLGWMRHVSDYLQVRDDRGDQPSALTREDMTAFLSWLRVKVPDADTRNLIVGATRRNVAFARRHLAQSGQAAEHIGGGFQLYHEDLPARTLRDPDEPGRALPPVVLAQLLDEDVLAPLGAKHLEYRLGFELIAHSGRRPAEICNLAADCLRYEEEPAPGGGKQRRPVLRYLREKPPSKWLSLPINQDAAELIEAQQRRLQARFPGTKLSKLALLPQRKCNPTGRLAVISATLGHRVSRWVRSIPTLLGEDGSAFPIENVYLYALRHSYAQRHADAGVPLDTLQKLMDHRTAATTQMYYRVTWARKREAVERLAPLTMDKDGRRVGFQSSLVESERLREEIGRIPVPFGLLHRAAQRSSARRALPVQPPVPRVRALPHRPLTPARPLRLPRAAARDPRAAPGRRPAARRVGAHQSDPGRRGDPHRPHPHSRRRGHAQRAHAGRARNAVGPVPRAARDPSTDGRRDRDRRDRRHAQPRTDVHAASVHASSLGPRSAGQDQRGVSDREANMRTAKRLINSEKRERVIAVIAQIKDQGRDDQLKATVIARRAGVHRSFVSNHFAAQIAHARAEIQSRFIAGLTGQTALSAASLRVEMETAKHQAREAQIEIRALKTRLARSLGEEIASEHPEHNVSTATVQDLHAQIGQLLSGQDELRRQLRDSDEELQAARRLNRTLVRERNTNAT